MAKHIVAFLCIPLVAHADVCITPSAPSKHLGLSLNVTNGGKYVRQVRNDPPVGQVTIKANNPVDLSATFCGAFDNRSADIWTYDRDYFFAAMLPLPDGYMSGPTPRFDLSVSTTGPNQFGMSTRNGVIEFKEPGDYIVGHMLHASILGEDGVFEPTRWQRHYWVSVYDAQRLPEPSAFWLLGLVGVCVVGYRHWRTRQ